MSETLRWPYALKFSFVVYLLSALEHIFPWGLLRDSHRDLIVLIPTSTLFMMKCNSMLAVAHIAIEACSSLSTSGAPCDVVASSPLSDGCAAEDAKFALLKCASELSSDLHSL